ncbi:MAG: serine hydrolase domain-containing protein [Candidatus Heimdallarchaeaceae archaeon]
MKRNFATISKRRKINLPVLIIFVLLISLSNKSAIVQGNSIVRDYWPTDGWQTKTLEEVDMNESRIDVMFDYIDFHEYNIDSLLVVKDGYLVVEEYPRADTSETFHNVFSVGKSFTSTLIGIAIEEGYIDSVDQKMFDFLYNASIPNIELKENITIRHLLTMTSGMYWNEMDVFYSDPSSNNTQMKASSNWVEYVLSSRMQYKPGTTWYYSGGSTHLLSAIIEKATGGSTLEYAYEHIFEPLGFTDVSWLQDPQGIVYGGGRLELLPRDMAKFGFLFLNNGSWDGTQLVPEVWVQDATNDTSSVTSEYYYGYLWWSFPQKNYCKAYGLNGQTICVIPDYDIVAVITADYQLASGSNAFDDLINSFIILAAKVGYSAATTETPLALFLPISMFVLCVTILKKRRIK